MNTFKKKALSALCFSMFLGTILAPLPAAGANPDALSGADFEPSKDAVTVDAFKKFDAGAVANDPRIIIKRIINIVMGFLGMLAVLVILFAGFKWMTAGGQKEQVESAQKLLINGVIGLIIIFSAWTVAWFAVNSIKINVQK